jgi:outer membrane protein assembly factor BamE (lipoprotein component of BamABCDE complex)
MRGTRVMKKILAGCAMLTWMAACAGAEAARDRTPAPQSGAAAWPAKWCEAAPGNTKEEIVAIMGPPSGTSPTTMTWSDNHYRFFAFLGSDGRIKQLDINTASLSAAEQAALKCATIRTKATMAQAAAKQSAKPPRTFPAACTLVTDAEMSAILGAKVAADPNDRSAGKTECNYKAVSGVMPAIKLSVDWGDGKIAMSAAGAMGKHEPGITNPYDGIGDQAVAVGPALMIRTGEDLMTIVFTGVSGAPAKARRIFETAKARM